MDNNFEALVFSIDESTKHRCKREWVEDARSKIMRKRAKKRDAPFHSDAASFDAVLGAVEAVTNARRPEITARTPPVLIFQWVKDSLERYKDQQRDIGARHERDAFATRLPREHGYEALKLLTRLNELLERSANSDL